MSEDGLSRRGVLRRGAATASAATLASLAGCSSIPFIGGGGMSNWLYEPGTVGDSDHYQFIEVNLQAVRNNEDNISDETFSFFESYEDQFDPTGVDFDSMNRAIGFTGVTVLKGSFNNGDISSELEDSDLDFDDSDYNGYTIYYNESNGIAFGVGSSLLRARAAGDEDAEAVAELAIDTNSGNEDRYKSESDAMNKFLNTAGNPTLVSGGTQEEVDEGVPEQGRFENQVASGQTTNINGETSNRKFIRVFDSQDDVDTGDFEDWTEAQEDETFDDVDDININQQGRAVVVNGTIDTDDL